MKRKFKPDQEYIRRTLSAAVDGIFREMRPEMGLPVEDGESPAKSVKIAGEISSLVQEIVGELVAESKVSTLSSVSVRHSEIFYTGGNIWCGVCQLPDGTWFSGELNDWGDFYATEKDAYECYGEGPGFIRHASGKDTGLLRELWEEMIRVEQTNIHGLAGYCDEWLEDLKEAVFD